MRFSVSEQLVSAIVPAFNAEKTLSETLDSIRAQTHPKLEIIVVDDGSTDSTPAIVRAHQSADPRIRLVQQENAGVASARNAAAAEARGAFLAPIDADDLWHPVKIERQLAQFAEGAADVGVVYSWFALLDAKSRVIHTKHCPEFAGWVLAILAEYNFVGNGSSPLIRMDAFRSTPGYDATLKARGGQGCEDWKLYCQLAERYEYSVTRGHLVGYRMLPGNMSSNSLEMLRSRDLAIADLLKSHPDLEPAFHLGRNRLTRFMLHRAVRRGRVAELRSLVKSMAAYDKRFLAETIAALPREVAAELRSKLGGRSSGQHYLECATMF